MRMKCFLIIMTVGILSLLVSGMALAADDKDQEYYLRLNLHQANVTGDFDGIGGWSYKTDSSTTAEFSMPKIDSNKGTALTFGERIGKFAGEISYSKAQLPTTFDINQNVGQVTYKNCSLYESFSFDVKYFIIDPGSSPFSLYGQFGYVLPTLNVHNNQVDCTTTTSGTTTTYSYSYPGDSKFKGTGIDFGVGTIFQVGPIAVDGAIIVTNLNFSNMQGSSLTNLKSNPNINMVSTEFRVGAIYKF